MVLILRKTSSIEPIIDTVLTISSEYASMRDFDAASEKTSSLSKVVLLSKLGR